MPVMVATRNQRLEHVDPGPPTPSAGPVAVTLAGPVPDAYGKEADCRLSSSRSRRAQFGSAWLRFGRMTK